VDATTIGLRCWCVCPFPLELSNSLIPSYRRSFVHAFILSCPSIVVHSFVHSFIHSLNNGCTGAKAGKEHALNATMFELDRYEMPIAFTASCLQVLVSCLFSAALFTRCLSACVC
jgi:hypothetical protein